jgi:CDP-diacylglycerol--glycerol-3-phosphate 3-phosphatidyltransferase
MIGDGATEGTATEDVPVPEPPANHRAIMDWPRFMDAWALAFDGFDLRHASPFARRWARLAYNCGSRLARMRVSTAALTMTVLVCGVFVPLLAAGGGPWALVAVAFVVLGLMAEATSRAVSVLLGKAMRREAFYRSLAERAGEICWLGAAALLGATTVLVLACLAVTAAHEYVRTRAAVSGLRPAGTATIGDRSLRVASILTLLVLAGLAGRGHQDLAAGTSTLVLALWALLGLFGFVQLLSIVRKALR